MKTSLVRSLLTLAFAAVVPLAVHAQGAPWPNKPIRVIVPFAPGAATDTVARQLLEQVSKQVGQPIIVENKPGAGGTIGASAAAHADADGYTFMIHSNSHTVTPATYRKLPYDPARDFIGVAPIVSVPMVLVIAPSKGIRSLADLVKAAKAKPGAMNYASAGAGGVTHLGAERLRIAGGYTGTHIPYKGSSEAITEVISGRVDYYFSPIGLALPFMKSDRLLGLAVSSSARSSALPDVPTSVEAGLANSDYDVWIGMFAPVKTPRAIVNRINEEVTKALRSPELREKFATLVMDPMFMTVDNFETFLKRDFAINAELVKAAGVEPN